jgi:DNA polymerase I-like protein with 3'-5' exonuclease and polymerase domains
MMATRVLGESEFTGIPINREYLQGLVVKYGDMIEELKEGVLGHKKVQKFIRISKKRKLKSLIQSVREEIDQINKENPPNKERLISNRTKKITDLLGGKEIKAMKFEFNLNSTPQMVSLFYDKKIGFGFPITKRTETGNPSVADEMLQEFKKVDTTGFVVMLEKFRELSKLYSTYIEGMLQHLSEDSVVHAKFNIHGTVTGRYSSSDPNMQNIPRVTTNADVKKMFIPPPGYLMLEVDYAQAELRVVAELALRGI